MKRIFYILCLLLCSCANHWYGIGVASTDKTETSYSVAIDHKSFGLGVFIPMSNIYYFCAGYSEIYIKQIDVAKILRQEKSLIKRRNE